MIAPVLVDVDGVLADFTGGCLGLAREAGILGKTEADITRWDTGACLGWPGLNDAVTRAVAHRDFCYRLREYEGAIAWLRQLEREHGEENVLACTSPWNAEWTSQRAAWLERRGVPLQRQIQCSAKHLVSGYLVDDRAGVHVKRAPGATFCLTRPWNASADEPARGGYEDAAMWLREARGLPSQ